MFQKICLKVKDYIQLNLNKAVGSHSDLIDMPLYTLLHIRIFKTLNSQKC